MVFSLLVMDVGFTSDFKQTAEINILKWAKIIVHHSDKWPHLTWKWVKQRNSTAEKRCVCLCVCVRTNVVLLCLCVFSWSDTYEYVNMCVRLFANERMCACLDVNLQSGGRLSGDSGPSEEEEEGGRGVRSGRRMGALLTASTPPACVGRQVGWGGGGPDGGHGGSPSVGVTPVRRCLPFILPAACLPLPQPFPPPPSSLASSSSSSGVAFRGGSSQQAREQWGGPLQMFYTQERSRVLSGHKHKLRQLLRHQQIASVPLKLLLSEMIGTRWCV